jgi:hypothetical protein
MYDPIHPGFYHFWSSASVGLLVWLSTYSTWSPWSLTAPDGSTIWKFWWQLRVPLLCAVWTHIVADVVEHGYLPRVDRAIVGVFELVSRVVG